MLAWRKFINGYANHVVLIDHILYDMNSSTYSPAYFSHDTNGLHVCAMLGANVVEYRQCYQKEFQKNILSVVEKLCSAAQTSICTQSPWRALRNSGKCGYRNVIGGYVVSKRVVTIPTRQGSSIVRLIRTCRREDDLICTFSGRVRGRVRGRLTEWVPRA